MLEAVCEDLLRSGRYDVCTTRDQRVSLSDLSGLDVFDVSSSEQEWEMFQKLAGDCEGTLIISPELEGILCNRIEWLQKNGLNRLMSSLEAARICADKWQFYQFCLKRGIATPQTYQWQNDLTEDSEFPLPFPFIVKPQWGAGSTMTAIIESRKNWTDFLSRRTTEHDFPPYLLQPFLSGEQVSIACLISSDRLSPDDGKSPDRKRITWCPLTKQFFDGLEYRGGVVPYECGYEREIRKIAEQIVKELTGLRGYIGFDFLLLPDSDRPVQILEINPRVSTSYLGYRALASEPPAAWLVQPESGSPLQWSSTQVQFDTCGNVRFLR